MIERRQTPRFAIDWPVDYKTITVNLKENQVYESNAIDISRGGLAFIAEEPLPDRSIIAFALYSPVFDHPSLAIGHWRRRKRIGQLWVVGVQWIGWEDCAQLNAILEYVG
jgi:c-di-GMP-binding flagellar brake protein YcgR